MLYAGKTIPITADQVWMVRRAIGETQDDFARRFGRSRFSVVRWECHGVKLKYQSDRWHTWQRSISLGLQNLQVKGASNDDIDCLLKLRIFREQ